jgi:hypothetical protein
VWDRDEKQILGQWTFVQTERPEVSQDNVVMFRETAAGQTPAIQSWYYPGERIGKEFIYPKNQAERIASRTKQDVLSNDGTISPPQPRPEASASVQPVPEPRAPEVQTPERVIAQADTSAARPADRTRPVEELPQTASPLALIGIIGALSLAGAGALRFVRP